MITHEQACEMAEELENRIGFDKYPEASEAEIALYVMWRGMLAYKWASEHPFRAWLMRLKKAWG